MNEPALNKLLDKSEYLRQLYENRFSHEQQMAKRALWQALIRDFLQKYIPVDSIVLDIGGGYCEFINQISAASKCLIDLNPDAQTFANPDVSVFRLNILDKGQYERIPHHHFDRIFVSNFFEHLKDQDELFEVLRFCYLKLKPGGSLLVIQPNYKYSYKEYYDFIDHYLPITHLSLSEALKALNFKIDEVIPRFLPFSTKGRPASVWMLRLYLKVPFLWNFFGGQMFLKASKPK
ncbi:methyltransferase domain-containing protein [Leptothoe sp. ISB3NOV94-8A]|nr:methyltransferase domain-containing protein [Leptothoe sp. LEGE 181152]